MRKSTPVGHWPAIRAQFEAGRLSNRALARKFGVAESTIRARSRAEGWQRAPLADDAPDHAQPAHCAPATADDLSAQARAILGRLLGELDATTRHRHELEKIIAEATREEGDGRRRRALLKRLDLPVRVAVLRDLVTALRAIEDTKPEGKKQAAAERADRAGKAGRYATPLAPKLVYQRGD